MTDSDQQPPRGENLPGDENAPDGEHTWVDLKDRFRANPEEGLRDPTAPVPVSRKGKKLERSTLLIGGAILAAALIVLLTFNHPKPKLDYDDLGAGISNATGLKGHLISRWQGKAQYQLEFGPIDPRENPGFALVAGNPPQPLSVNIRILDSSGFALCGKEILLPFHPGGTGPLAPASPLASGGKVSKALEERQANLELMQVQEQDRERGKDVFQGKLGSDGQISEISAQGELPCSAEQYKHFDYWDFSTNFPTVDEQDQLLKHVHGAGVQTASEARKVAARIAAAKKAQSAFYIEGDDTVSAYEASSGALETSENRTFYIGRKNEQAIAAAWAGGFAHFHYKCDQHATCALQRAGTSTVITGRINE